VKKFLTQEKNPQTTLLPCLQENTPPRSKPTQNHALFSHNLSTQESAKLTDTVTKRSYKQQFNANYRSGLGEDR